VWGYLLVILCAYILLTLFSEEWVFTNDFFVGNTSTQFSIYSKDEFLKTREKFWWVPYLIQIVSVIFKVLFAALCIFIGFALNDIDFTFKDLLGSVIIAETCAVYNSFCKSR
jgi:ABC-type glycerol-3-phosphate transport system permease component